MIPFVNEPAVLGVTFLGVALMGVDRDGLSWEFPPGVEDRQASRDETSTLCRLDTSLVRVHNV